MRILFALLVVLFFSGNAFSKSTYSEDFDDSSWAGFLHANWCTYSYSCRLVDSPLNKPGKSFKAEYREANCNGTRSTMGDELAAVQPPAGCVDDCDVWIGLRIYVNSNTFDSDPYPMALFQYHATLDASDNYARPIWGLIYDTGAIRNLAYGCSSGDCGGVWSYVSDTAYVGTMVEDAWNDFAVKVHLSWSTENGSINIWQNGVEEYSSSGHYLGFDDERPGYFKFGQYGWECNSNDVARESFTDDVNICYGNDCTICDVLPEGSAVPSGYSCP